MSEKRIWDLPVRITHWSLAFSFFGAFITAEVNFTIHMWFAFLCLTLVIFRVFWGLIGSQTARFTQFVKAPKAAANYLLGLLKFKPQHFWGHNPLGGYVVLAILGLMAVVVMAGTFASDDGFYGPWARSVSHGASDLLKDLHEVLANFLMFIVAVHIAAVLFYKFILRDDLIKPMVTGTREDDETFNEPKFAPIWLAVITFAIALTISGALFRFWLL